MKSAVGSCWTRKCVRACVTLDGRALGRICDKKGVEGTLASKCLGERRQRRKVRPKREARKERTKRHSPKLATWAEKKFIVSVDEVYVYETFVYPCSPTGFYNFDDWKMKPAKQVRSLGQTQSQSQSKRNRSPSVQPMDVETYFALLAESAYLNSKKQQDQRAKEVILVEDEDDQDDEDDENDGYYIYDEYGELNGANGEKEELEFQNST